MDAINSLTIGDRMPAFQTHDEEGNPVSSQDLMGTKAVIYFYPKDDTPGCTLEACSFRDSMDLLDSRGVIIVGVSPDDGQSHRQFIDKHELNFGLFSDPQLAMAKKFGAVKVKSDGSMAIERSTFLIDETGIIRWIEKPVDVNGHAERVMHAIDSLP